MDDTFPSSRFTSSNITLSSKTWHLPALALDIIYQIRPTALHHNQRPLEIPTISFMSSNNLTFSDTYLREHSVCQPTQYYHWGFSSLLLLVFCLLTLVFAITLTLTCLHGDAFWNSKMDRFMYDVPFHVRRSVSCTTLTTTEMLSILSMSLTIDFWLPPCRICLEGSFFEKSIRRTEESVSNLQESRQRGRKSGERTGWLEKRSENGGIEKGHEPDFNLCYGCFLDCR